MEVNLSVITVLGGYVGQIAAVIVMLKGITKRLDKINGRVDKVEDENLGHIKEFHSVKK